jgi:hypothetical protein
MLACGALAAFRIGDLKSRLFHRQPPIHSLAVLPLKNLSDDPSQNYFASGMTEELITDLSQISALRVFPALPPRHTPAHANPYVRLRVS